MYTVHGLYCYKQNEYHTNSWIKILWYDDHTIFGMPSVNTEIIPFIFH